MPDETIQDVIRRTAREHDLPEALALGVAEQESSFNPFAENPKIVPGESGPAYGAFQLIPSTAARFKGDYRNPDDNIRMGVQYLKELFDRHQGDEDKILKEYGGVVRDTTYIPTAREKIARWYAQQPQTAQPGQQPGTQPQYPVLRQPTWGEKHPYLNTFVNSLDPNERGGRQNIAGGVGGAIGGTIGALFSGGALAVPGAVLGAGTMGALENALVEETGIGDWIAEHLPGKTDEPPRPPSGESPDARSAWAAFDQGIGEVVGQTGATALKGGIKRAFQGRLAKQIATNLTDRATAQIEALRANLQQMISRHAQFGVNEAQAMRDLIRRQNQPIRSAIGDVRTEQALGATRQTAAADAGRAGIQTARTASEAGVEAARAQAEQALASYDTALTDAFNQNRPSIVDAGTSIIDVVEGPAGAHRKALGEAVDKAAQGGGPVKTGDLRTDVKRIVERELLPPEVAAPRTVAPPQPSTIIDPSTGQPFASAAPTTPAGAIPQAPSAGTLDELLAGITEAEWAELVKHPAMPVLKRILQAGDEIPFEAAHQLKRQLQEAANYDSPIKSRVQAISEHLAGKLRAGMSGNPAYDAATQAYEAAVPAFTENIGAQVKELARSAPERLVQMIDPKNITAAKQLVSLLTEHAEKGGGKEGAEAGAAALDKVRRAWIQERLFKGGFRDLDKRMFDLDQNPEFLKAFFGDEGSERLLTRLREIGEIYTQHVEAVAKAPQAAAKTGKAGVTQAIGADVAGKRAAKATTEQAVERARRKVQLGKDTKAQAVEAAKQRAEAAGLGRQQAERDLSEQIRQRALGTPEEQAFNRSTLSPKNARDPGEMAVDAMQVAFRGLANRWGGLGFVRLAKGASDEDMLRFLVHADDTWYKQFTDKTIRALRSPAGRAAVGGVTRPVQDVTKLKPSEIHLTIRGDDKD